MKKMIIAAAVLGMAGLGIQSAKASDLGKFLDGALAIHLAAIHAVTDVVHDVTPRVNVNVAPARPAYYPQPAYYAPAPRVVYVPAPPPRVVYYQPARVYYAPRVASYSNRNHRDRDDRYDIHGGYRR